MRRRIIASFSVVLVLRNRDLLSTLRPIIYITVLIVNVPHIISLFLLYLGIYLLKSNWFLQWIIIISNIRYLIYFMNILDYLLLLICIIICIILIDSPCCLVIYCICLILRWRIWKPSSISLNSNLISRLSNFSSSGWWFILIIGFFIGFHNNPNTHLLLLTICMLASIIKVIAWMNLIALVLL